MDPLFIEGFPKYEEHGKEHRGLGDLNMTNKTN
jgi:hypothetical protein